VRSPLVRFPEYSIIRADELARGYHRRWVHGAVIAVLVGYSVAIVAQFVVDPTPFPDVLTEIGAWVFGMIGLLILRTRHVLIAACVVVVAVWLELHIGLALGGSLRSSGAPVLPLAIVGTGLLLGGRAAMAMSAVTAISAPLAVHLGGMLDPNAAGLAADGARYVVVLAATVLGAGFLTYLSLLTFGEVLNAAKASERKSSDLVKNAPDGILSMDASGRIESLNPAAQRILGFTEAACLGKSLVELLAPMSDTACVLSDLAPENEKAVELTLERPDGQRIVVEVTSTRTPRADGTEPLEVMLRDVSDRKLAEERAVQLGRIVEDAVTETYLFHSDTLRLLLVNRGARKNLGYMLEELQNLAVTDINPALTLEVVRELQTELKSDPEAMLFQRSVHKRSDGSAYPVELQLQAASFEGTSAIVIFAQDISERVGAEEEQRLLQLQLQQAQKMEAVGQLAGGVAHDFNNLLTAIGGYAAFLTESPDEKTRQFAGEIEKAQRRGASLTRQLLTFAHKGVVQPRLLSVGEITSEMQDLLHRLLGEHITLNIETHGAGCIVGDRTQVEQVLLNLVTNSRDAMPGGGTVTVEVIDLLQVKPGSVALRVTDTGVGMDEKTKRQIFDPFFTTKGRDRGTGLGLATVHGIVGQHGGRIEVDTAPGEGTAVTVLWPAASDIEVKERSAAEVSVATTLKGTVLLVEDNEQARDVAKLVLQRAGLDVIEAADGDEGLRTAHEHADRIDLVLTDVVMPGISGIEMVRRFREQHPHVPALYMTGYMEDPSGVSSYGGIDTARDVIMKPFTPEELRCRVAEVLLMD
jgi:two-component system cell cycle sensor histidine kinase/response regulator CckA